MGEEGEDGVEALAEQAGTAYAEGNHRMSNHLLQALLKHRDNDPKVLHNIAILEYVAGDCCEPRKLLQELDRQKKRVDDARAESESGEGVLVEVTIGDADPSLTAYNTAVVLFQLKQYTRCRAGLEEMFSNIEPIDEFLAFKVCFLLLDVYLLQRQTEKATEVLAYLERSYAILTKPEGSKENGLDATGESEKGAAVIQGDWPNKKSARRPPTDIAPEDVRAALHIYKAKLSLMARPSKSSKREIKTTLNACAQNTTGLFLKSNLEYLRQNFRKAIKLLNNSCQKNDRDPNVPALYFNNMGCIHHCMRRHAAANFYFTRALQENSRLYDQPGSENRSTDSVALHVFSCDRRCELEYNRGLQLLLSGRPEQAFASFQGALSLMHRQPRIWLRIGESCVAMHVQQQQQQEREEQAGSRLSPLVKCAAGVGGNRRLVLPVKGTTIDKADEEKTVPAADASASSSPTPACTLAFGVKCLRNALLLCESLLGSVSAGDYSALLQSSAQGNLSASEEYALQLHAMHRLSLLLLSWTALAQDDYLAALSWAQQLLDTKDCPANIKLYAHLYACDALCQLNRSNEALTHLSSALELGETFATVCSSGSVEGSTADGELDTIRNPYNPGATSKSAARGLLYSNLAAVYILQGDSQQAMQYVQQALELTPTSRQSLLCLVYLQLESGNTESAVEILKKQRHVPK